MEGEKMTSLSKALADYLAAHARYAAAQRLDVRAGRTFFKLAKRVGDERAYVIAGCALADERSLRASRDKRNARATLVAALRGAGIVERIGIVGAAMCVDLPTPANANVAGREPELWA
jgi:hypothetical protein